MTHHNEHLTINITQITMNLKVILFKVFKGLVSVRLLKVLKGLKVLKLLKVLKGMEHSRMSVSCYESYFFFGVRKLSGRKVI